MPYQCNFLIKYATFSANRRTVPHPFLIGQGLTRGPEPKTMFQ